MKAQMKMAETIIVMLIFLVLLAFGIIFYTQFQSTINKGKGGERFGMFTVQVAQRVESLPEIQCTIEGTADYDCVDVYKLMAFAQTSEVSRGIYDKIMPNTRVSAISTYPETGRWLLYENVQTNKPERFRNFTLPVALFDPVKETYSMGILLVEVYQ